MTSPVKRLLYASVASAGAFALWLLTSPVRWGEPCCLRVAVVCAAAALGVGAAGTLVSFFTDRRTGIAAALILAFLPWIWLGASTGRLAVAAAGGGVFAVTLVVAYVLRRLSGSDLPEDEDSETPPPPVPVPWADRSPRERLLTVVSWVFFGGAVVFALASATSHDYRYGRIGRAYAEGVAAEAAGRWVVSNGLLELCPTPLTPGEWNLLSFRETDAVGRSQLVARVRKAWPNETNLWAAAQVSARSLAVAGLAAHPERFLLLDGRMTDEASWRSRWDALTPYLGSSDPMVTLVRGAMDYEGSGLAVRLQTEGRTNAAERLREFLRTNVRRGRRGQPERVGEPRLPNETVVVWHAAMTNALSRGAFGEAGQLARRILDVPGWSEFAPANATLGAMTAREGDYVASERFYRTAFAAKAEPDARLCNDFADTLLHLGKLDEAERYARMAVAKSTERNWLVRLTLLQVLAAAKRGEPSERAALEKSIRHHAPREVREKLRTIISASPFP